MPPKKQQRAVQPSSSSASTTGSTKKRKSNDVVVGKMAFDSFNETRARALAEQKQLEEDNRKKQQKSVEATRTISSPTAAVDVAEKPKRKYTKKSTATAAVGPALASASPVQVQNSSAMMFTMGSTSTTNTTPTTTTKSKNRVQTQSTSTPKTKVGRPSKAMLAEREAFRLKQEQERQQQQQLQESAQLLASTAVSAAAAAAAKTPISAPKSQTMNRTPFSTLIQNTTNHDDDDDGVQSAAKRRRTDDTTKTNGSSIHINNTSFTPGVNNGNKVTVSSPLTTVVENKSSSLFRNVPEQQQYQKQQPQQPVPVQGATLAQATTPPRPSQQYLVAAQAQPTQQQQQYQQQKQTVTVMSHTNNTNNNWQQPDGVQPTQVSTTTGVKAPFGSPIPESVLRRRRNSTTTSTNEPHAFGKTLNGSIATTRTTTTTQNSLSGPPIMNTNIVTKTSNSDVPATTTTRTTRIEQTTVTQRRITTDPSRTSPPAGAVSIVAKPPSTTTLAQARTESRPSSAATATPVIATRNPSPVPNTTSITTVHPHVQMSNDYSNNNNIVVEPPQPPPHISRETVSGQNSPFSKNEVHIYNENVFDNNNEDDEDDDDDSSNDNGSVEDGEIRTVLETLLPNREQHDPLDDYNDEQEGRTDIWYSKYDRLLVGFAALAFVVILVCVVIALFWVGFFVISYMFAYLEGSNVSPSSGSTTEGWLSLRLKSHGSTHNQTISSSSSVTGSLPPCFTDHITGAVPTFSGMYNANTATDGEDSLFVSIPPQCVGEPTTFVSCPQGGICSNGILEQCVATAASSGTTDEGEQSIDVSAINFLQMSSSSDSCQLTELASSYVATMKSLLDDWTFLTKCGTGYAECTSTSNNTCRLPLPPSISIHDAALSRHPFFLLDDIVTQLSLPFLDVNALTSILAVATNSSTDVFVVTTAPTELIGKNNSNDININYMMALHSDAPTKSTPCSCSLKLLTKWIATLCFSTIWKVLGMVLLGIWHLSRDAPMISTVVVVGGTGVAFTINYIQTKRLEQQQLEQDVIYLRKRVCNELSDHPTLAIPIHLLLERIVWADYPSNKKRRQYLSNIVWSYVVLDIRSDRRIAKTTRQLQSDGGRIYEHWQWIDPIGST